MSNEESKASILGLLCVIASVLILSIREIYFSAILRTVPLSVLLFVTFGFSTLMFILLTASKFSELKQLVRNNFADVVKLNITTALMWVAFLFALKWIQPAIVASINGGMMPVTSVFLSVLMIKGQKVFASDRVAAIGVACFVAFMVIVLVSQGLPGTTGGTQGAWLGIVGAIVSGTVTALNNIYAKRLAVAGWNAKQVLAVRFHLLVSVSLLFVLKDFGSLSIDLPGFVKLLAVALGGMIAPIYLLQLGLGRTDVNIVALLMAIGPLLTFTLQKSIGGIPISELALVGIAGVAVSVIAGVVLRVRRERALG